jgi:hypothetical protein
MSQCWKKEAVFGLKMAILGVKLPRLGILKDQGRRPRWTESIAVGGGGFVEHTKAPLGIKAIGRSLSIS